jgi:hypothetical protein
MRRARQGQPLQPGLLGQWLRLGPLAQMWQPGLLAWLGPLSA